MTDKDSAVFSPKSVCDLLGRVGTMQAAVYLFVNEFGESKVDKLSPARRSQIKTAANNAVEFCAKMGALYGQVKRYTEVCCFFSCHLKNKTPTKN